MTDACRLLHHVYSTRTTQWIVGSYLFLLSALLGGCGSNGASSTEEAGNGAPPVNFYDPSATINFNSIDPCIDPGTDPIFSADPELNRNDTYEYVYTEPGAHTFPEDTCVAQFDAAGPQTLLEILRPRKTEFENCTGFALYLTKNVSALRDADLRTLQLLNRKEEEGGIGGGRLTRLYVYNLKSIQGGVECTPDSGAVWPNTLLTCANTKVIGGHTWMWANGWADGWVKNLVMDDLEEAPDGAFCSAKFYTLSLRGLKTVGKMAFGEQPHGHLRVLYLPSVTTIGEHAFRRIQIAPEVIAKVVLPRVTSIADYAFDDNTDLGYVNAPALVSIGRNVFNDTGKLISVNMPKLKEMSHACFGINDSMRVLRLPSLVALNGDGLNTLNQLRFFYAPNLEYLAGGALGNNPRLQAVYLPKANRFDANALIGASSLTKLALPADNLKLRDLALAGTGLTELSLGGSGTILEGSPFANDPELATIHFGSSPPTQSDSAFAGTSNALLGYYTGDDPAWSTFTFNGNPNATLAKE